MTDQLQHKGDLSQRIDAGESQFRALIEQNADGMIVLRENGVICYANPAAESLFACSGEQLRGQMFGVPVVPNEKTEINVFQHGSPERIAEMRTVPIAWCGEPAFLASLRDVTARKRAEEEAREAVRLRDEFLAMLSHELRNPLGAILNACHVMDHEGVGGTNFHRAGQVVRRQSQQMARLLDDLLDVSRVTQGKIELKRELLDIEQVVHEAVQTIQPMIDARGHHLLIDLPRSPLYVDGDAARLQQILVNLLSNAAKYTPNGGEIRFSVSGDGSEVVFRVRDNGVGITPEMMDNVFDLFVQGERTLDRSNGGLGIGLTLVKSLVEMHDGRVTARSPGRNRGSEFAVWLPAVIPPPEESSHSSDDALAARDARIVIVEDMPDNRDMLCSLLELEGYQVDTAKDANEALRVIRKHRPGVALIDIGLPGMDGLKLARKLRRDPSNKHLYLIALTGYSSKADRRATQKAGFDAHLVKPLNIDELAELLSACAAK